MPLLEILETANLYLRSSPAGRNMDDSYALGMGRKRARPSTPEPIVKFSRIAARNPSAADYLAVDARIVYNKMVENAATFAMAVVRIQRAFRRRLHQLRVIAFRRRLHQLGLA